MSSDTLWYGFLDAGQKSSPVVMDSRLQTGQPDTVYLYNHTRGTILEYRRAIVEPKLRELQGAERDLAGELRSAYRKARTGFTPRVARVTQLLEKSRAPAAKSPVPLPEAEPEDLGDMADSFLDIEDDEDDSAAA